MSSLTSTKCQWIYDFFLSLDLDEIFSVVPTSESEPEIVSIGKEAELEAAKTVVENVRELSVSQISKLP